MDDLRCYSFKVEWSVEDQEHVATCAQLPSLSWLDEDAGEALRGLQRLVREAVEDERASDD
jgi:hypothetical protein